MMDLLFSAPTTLAPHLASGANGLTFAFEKASIPGLAVCAALVVLSCFSWAVMLTKFRAVRRLRRANAAFAGAYAERRDPLGLWLDAEDTGDTPLARVYHSGASELAFHLTGCADADEDCAAAQIDSAGKLTPTHMEAVECAMERSIGGDTNRLESGMGLLATAVSGAPFIGLLGTVWGVMDTFSAVAAAEGAASLKTMAPGVSSALLTTVIGLLVAIPAMFGYNYLVNRIRGLVAELDTFRNELRTAFERWYVDHGKPIASVTAAPGRRISASSLVTGNHDDAAATPSHRVVKRETARIPSVAAMRSAAPTAFAELDS